MGLLMQQLYLSELLPSQYNIETPDLADQDSAVALQSSQIAAVWHA